MVSRTEPSAKVKGLRAEQNPKAFSPMVSRTEPSAKLMVWRVEQA